MTTTELSPADISNINEFVMAGETLAAVEYVINKYGIDFGMQSIWSMASPKLIGWKLH